MTKYLHYPIKSQASAHNTCNPKSHLMNHVMNKPSLSNSERMTDMGFKVQCKIYFRCKDDRLESLKRMCLCARDASTASETT